MIRLASANWFALCALLIGVTTASLMAQSQGNTDPKKGRVTANPTSGNKYTIEQEIKLGREAAAEVEKKLPLVPADNPASVYINTLGQKIAAEAPGYKFPYTFKIVQEKSVNAFALPGGPIYVHTGLIAQASEAELAGVLGHEIAHVVMRHSTRQASRQMKAQIPLAILGGVLGATVGGWTGALAQMGISFTAGSVFLKYSRDAETEADMVGTQIMYDAGYNPRAIVTFFRKLEAEGSKGGPEFLNSHPNPGNRAQQVSQILSRYPPKEYPSTDSAEYVAAKEAVAALPDKTPGPAPAPELARLSIRDITGGPFASYRQAEYTIAYPQNWEAEASGGLSVTFHPEGGLSANALSYGAMISGFSPQPRTNSADEAMRQLIANIRQTDPSLRPQGKPQTFSLHRRRADQVDFLGNSPVRANGRALGERVRLVALPERRGEFLYLLFVAPDADFKALWPTFEQMLYSLQPS